VKGTLKKFIRGKHFMRSVPVQVKSLKKQRQKPVRKEEYENNHVW
jgi:hypothetical protein